MHVVLYYLDRCFHVYMMGVFGSSYERVFVFIVPHMYMISQRLQHRERRGKRMQ